eukprot:TRINITY_DN2289_c0_g1_i3.p1 TRINITY_DN2289_c0_g1~~TRINITY_DN2289_c0_g1_i3.p1  ORF type:complete len:219 (+),score=49.63 TRINITY_DN2289_c0_g1_i3:628-1284(+)
MRTVSPGVSPTLRSPCSTPPNMSPRKSLGEFMAQAIVEEDPTKVSTSSPLDCPKRSTNSEKKHKKFHGDQELYAARRSGSSLDLKEQGSGVGKSPRSYHPRTSSPRREIVQTESQISPRIPSSYEEATISNIPEIVQEETNGETPKRTITIKLKKESSRRNRALNQGKIITTPPSTPPTTPSIITPPPSPSNTSFPTDTETSLLQPVTPIIVELADQQ